VEAVQEGDRDIFIFDICGIKSQSIFGSRGTKSRFGRATSITLQNSIGHALRRREDISEDAARAEKNLGVDEHAGDRGKSKEDSRSCPLLICTYNPD